MSEDTTRTTQMDDRTLGSVSGNGYAKADDVVRLVRELAPGICPKYELIDMSEVTAYAEEMTAHGNLPLLDLDLKVTNDLQRGVLGYSLGTCYPTPHATTLGRAFAPKSPEC